MKLTDICEFQGGSQPPKNEWSDEPRDGYIRMLQIRDYTQENSKTDINTFQVYRKEEEKYYDKSREKKENGMTKQLSDQFKNENKDILNNKTLNKFDSEKKDILRYSYKENYLNRFFLILKD